MAWFVWAFGDQFVIEYDFLTSDVLKQLSIGKLPVQVGATAGEIVGPIDMLDK